MRILLVLMFWLATLHVQARLGETEAEVGARYGKAITVEKGAGSRDSKCLYSHNGYRVVVRFLDGKSAFEEYVKEDLRNNTLSDDEVKGLLVENCLGLTWTRLRSTEMDSPMEKNWELGIPGKTVAGASTKYPYTKLTIATSEFVHYNSDFENAPKEKAEPADP